MVLKYESSILSDCGVHQSRCTNQKRNSVCSSRTMIYGVLFCFSQTFLLFLYVYIYCQNSIEAHIVEILSMNVLTGIMKTAILYDIKQNEHEQFLA